MRNDLCRSCGRWHDHTGRPIVAVIDWHGKRWAIPKGHMPINNTDDLGGREYAACGSAPPATDQTETEDAEG